MKKTLKYFVCMLLMLALFAGMSYHAAAEGADVPDSETEKNGDVYILYTSDIHCGIDQGFGLAGLKEIRNSLEEAGYTTILVDDGDAVQGEVLGTLTKGEVMIELMNAMHYDLAIPGNHEFDYGMDQLMHFAELADFPYISCNFTKDGELVFAPYQIIEAAGMRIAFVGMTTPKTMSSTSRKTYEDEDGNLIYGFSQSESGETLYRAVQQAVDDARAEGADYVYAMGHMGLEQFCSPYTYADVIANTTGIDVFLDGHSHDTEQVVMKNKEGKDVVRSACGTKMEAIGYSHISKDTGIVETDIWRWGNGVSAPELMGIRNEISGLIQEKEASVEELLDTVIGYSEVLLTISDPEAMDENGRPLRMVRRAETNLGDFCTDAFRDQTGADIAIINGGSLRADIKMGSVTYRDIISAMPYGNTICVIEISGQQILDALEWGVRGLPGESSGFQHVSGLSFDIDVSIPTSCTADENGIFSGVAGEYRVRNVMVGDEPLDVNQTYTLAGNDYTLLKEGSGMKVFNGSKVLQDSVKLDNQCMIDYVQETLNGVIGEAYADPYGQERIRIIGGEEN